jgi:hypothetical protein
MEGNNLTESQKEELSNSLADAWEKYTWLFGEPPHGTKQQMQALVELVKLGPAFSAGDSEPAKLLKWFRDKKCGIAEEGSPVLIAIYDGDSGHVLGRGRSILSAIRAARKENQ